MPYSNEIASGDSLIWLANSQILKEFKGTILIKEENTPVEPPILNVSRSTGWPRRVIAIDGSNIIHRVNNGFPGAEAGLLMTSVVAIKLNQLEDLVVSTIPRPSFFRDIESVHTLEAAMPGIGVVRKDVTDDTPIDFFRQKTYDILTNAIASNHETLLETMRYMCEAVDFQTTIDCPAVDCDEKYKREMDEYTCHCERQEKMFETDMLRLHEYFDGVRTGGEALGRLRSVMEILILLNILRFFIKYSPTYLDTCAFVLDGPLAIFMVSYYANKPQKLFMVIHLSFLQAIQRINLIFFSLRRHISVSLTIAKIAGSDCGCWGKVHRYLIGKETAGRPAENSTTKCCPMFFL